MPVFHLYFVFDNEVSNSFHPTGEKHAMNIALDHIAKAMGDGNSSETDYEEVDQGRGKRKKVPNKRLASSPQVCSFNCKTCIVFTILTFLTS